MNPFKNKLFVFVVAAILAFTAAFPAGFVAQAQSGNTVISKDQYTCRVYLTGTDKSAWKWAMDNCGFKEANGGKGNLSEFQARNSGLVVGENLLYLVWPQQLPQGYNPGGSSAPAAPAQPAPDQQSAPAVQQPSADVAITELFPGEFFQIAPDPSRTVWKKVQVEKCFLFWCHMEEDNVQLPANVEPQVPYVRLQETIFKSQCDDRINYLYDPRVLGGDFITINCSKWGYEGQVDVVDIAMLGTLASPWPGDEEVVGVVWLGKSAIKLILVAGSAYLAANAAIAAKAVRVPAGPIHSTPDHDPYIKGSTANKILMWMVGAAATLFGNRNPNSRCGYWELEGKPLRYVWWVFTHSTNNQRAGRILWAFVDSNRFGGAFTGKLENSLSTIPDTMKPAPGKPAPRWREVPCNTMPPFGGFAMP